jgi:hypothetical protein
VDTEETAPAAPAAADAPCEDCAKQATGKSMERAAGILAIGFAIFLGLMGFDLLTGGSLSDWAGFHGG